MQEQRTAILSSLAQCLACGRCSENISDEWMNEQIDEAIFIHLKQVLYDIFNFLGFDFFQNICSKISFPLEHDFPWWNSRIGAEELCFPSVICQHRTICSRQRASGFLSCSKRSFQGSFCCLAFFASLGLFWALNPPPPRNHFYKSEPFIIIQVRFLHNPYVS